MDVLLGPVAKLLITVIDLYIWIVVIGVILSGLVAFNVINSSNRFVYIVGEFIHRATDPPLQKIRNILPAMGNFDLSPIILILGLVLLHDVLIKMMMKFG
ncbi:MAG: YggT family protein [Rhodospirillaceae bacterium]|nr:YggT family protein [Rhodospirillaceae bacterium]